MEYDNSDPSADDTGECVMNCAKTTDDFTLTFELSPCLGTGCLRCKRVVGCIACDVDQGFYLEQATGLCRTTLSIPVFTDFGSTDYDLYGYNVEEYY